MSYREILKRLEALPENKRILAGGVYRFTNGDCGCAIGKVLPSLYNHVRKLRKNSSRIAHLVLITELYSGGRSDSRFRGIYGKILRELKELGATNEELVELQRINDTCVGRSNRRETRKTRYVTVVNWLQDRVAQEIPTRPVG